MVLPRGKDAFAWNEGIFMNLTPARSVALQ